MTTQKRDGEERKPVCCPFCDTEIMEADLPFCRICKANIVYCQQCQQPLPRGERVCPACGAITRS
ncbi:MAG: zinc ribbon domain-containing protein [Chloroflexi bacterium]|nr:zinc ribbon domain-containing protein [Chloroflexota bacterium]